jgi:hypothetical protein
MYYVNNSIQNTCAPHTNVRISIFWESEHQFSLCQPTTRLNFDQKYYFLDLRLYTITDRIFYVRVRLLFILDSRNDKIIEPGLASRIYLVVFPYMQLINIYCW